MVSSRGSGDFRSGDKCPGCDKVYKRRGWFARHLRRIHPKAGFTRVFFYYEDRFLSNTLRTPTLADIMKNTRKGTITFRSYNGLASAN